VKSCVEVGKVSQVWEHFSATLFVTLAMNIEVIKGEAAELCVVILRNLKIRQKITNGPRLSTSTSSRSSASK
jgi:hypothetical protein